MDFLFTGKEKNEILVEALLSPKVGEVLKEFEGRSLKSGKQQKTIVSLSH
jgi:hypothetical protein